MNVNGGSDADRESLRSFLRGWRRARCTQLNRSAKAERAWFPRELAAAVLAFAANPRQSSADPAADWVWLCWRFCPAS